jgi:hypothetical protein
MSSAEPIDREKQGDDYHDFWMQFLAFLDTHPKVAAQEGEAPGVLSFLYNETPLKITVE